jgi:hypothetical protein
MYAIINILILIVLQISANCQENTESQLLLNSTEELVGDAAEHHSPLAEVFAHTPLNEDDYSSTKEFPKEKLFYEKYLSDDAHWKAEPSLSNLQSSLKEEENDLSFLNYSSRLHRRKIVKEIEEQKNISSSPKSLNPPVKNSDLLLHARL